VADTEGFGECCRVATVLKFHTEHKRMISRLEGRPDGRIFDVEPTRASRLLMDHIRGLGIEDATDHDGKVIGHKSFKSWRPRFCSKLEDLTTRDRSRFLAGHAAGDIHARHMCDDWVCPVYYVTGDDKRFVLDVQIDCINCHPDDPETPDFTKTKAQIIANALNIAAATNPVWLTCLSSFIKE
jgi:hypothetical protein